MYILKCSGMELRELYTLRQDVMRVNYYLDDGNH